MGIKSTYDIDRQTALDVILDKINTCTNKQLSSILLEFEESHFRNYAVHDRITDDMSRSDMVIKNVHEFKNKI